MDTSVETIHTQTKNYIRHWPLWLVAVMAFLALFASIFLWQRMWLVQEQVARQNLTAQQDASEAKIYAKNAQDIAQSAQINVAMYGAQIDQLNAQRAQMKELSQSLSKTRNENLSENLAAILQMSYQQAEMTGDTTVILGALDSAKSRLSERQDLRFQDVLRLISANINSLKTANILDMHAALIQFSMVVSMVDSLPLANDMNSMVKKTKKSHSVKKDAERRWWLAAYDEFIDQIRTLIRVRQLDNKDAALISPEQALYWRENMKLELLNARISLLTRHETSARIGVENVVASINRYCDNSSSKTKAMINLLEQLQYRMHASQLPSIEKTIVALRVISGR
jgi:uroporphyrin-III C-methyltransferase